MFNEVNIFCKIVFLNMCIEVILYVQLSYFLCVLRLSFMFNEVRKIVLTLLFSGLSNILLIINNKL